MTPREEAQQEAERTYERFINWSKNALYIIVIIIILLALNNFGVDGTGSGYNGEQYDPKIN